MRKNTFIFFVLFSVLVLSCNNDDFSPYSDLDRGLVSYCMLDTRSNSQYVRVQQKYLSSDFKMLNNKTQLILAENFGEGYIFRDTIIPGFENYNMFYLQKFTLKRGTQYRLTIKSDSLYQYSDVAIPPVSGISFNQKMDTISNNMGIFVRFTFQAEFPNSAPIVSCVKIFVDYEVIEKNSVSKRIVEIPLVVGKIQNRKNLWYLWETRLPVSRILSEYTETLPTNISDIPVSYPSLIKARNSPFYEKDSKGKIFITYSVENLFFALSKIACCEDHRRVKIKRGFAVFYSIDESYYDNFMSNKGEEYSIRLDQRLDYTNFVSNNGKATGFLGSITTDTTDFKIFKYYIDKFSFIDGQ